MRSILAAMGSLFVLAVACATEAVPARQPTPCENLPETAAPCDGSDGARPQFPLVVDASSMPTGSEVEGRGRPGSANSNAGRVPPDGSEGTAPTSEQRLVRVAKRISWRQLQ